MLHKFNKFVSLIKSFRSMSSWEYSFHCSVHLFFFIRTFVLFIDSGFWSIIYVIYVYICSTSSKYLFDVFRSFVPWVNHICSQWIDILFPVIHITIHSIENLVTNIFTEECAGGAPKQTSVHLRVTNLYPYQSKHPCQLIFWITTVNAYSPWTSQ